MNGGNLTMGRYSQECGYTRKLAVWFRKFL